MSLSPLELMKGNIVCYEGGVRKVKAVSELIMLEGDKNWIGAGLMNGEPVTTSWLEKFGFIEAIYTDGEIYMQLDRTDYSYSPYNLNKSWKCYRMRKYKDDWYFEIHKDARGHLFSFQEKCNYIHRLQVLYFAFTESHLAIPKLPKK